MPIEVSLHPKVGLAALLRHAPAPASTCPTAYKAPTFGAIAEAARYRGALVAFGTLSVLRPLRVRRGQRLRRKASTKRRKSSTDTDDLSTDTKKTSPQASRKTKKSSTDTVDLSPDTAKTSSNTEVASTNKQVKEANELRSSETRQKLRDLGRKLDKKYEDKAMEEVEFMTTGLPSLDRATGGGLPRGRMVEIFGRPGSGKTTLALGAIAAAQKAGRNAVFLDVEHALDPVLAANIGVDLESMKQDGLIRQPTCAEETLAMAEDCMDSGIIDLIVLDSVAALVPKEEFESGFDSKNYALLPRIMSLAIRKFDKKCSASRCTLVMLNQLRVVNMSGYGNPEGTPGGNALKYGTSLRLEVKGGTTKSDRLTRPGEERPYASKHTVIVARNKLGIPYESVQLHNNLGHGFSLEYDLLSLAEKAGVITRRGAWFYYGEEKLGQGQQKALDRLEGDADLRAKLSCELEVAAVS